MTREEAVKYLIKPVATSTKIGEEKQKEFEAYEMAIEALSVEAEQHWIPCSEGLPKENGEYIVSLEDSVYPWAKFFNGKWFMLSFNGIAREFGEYEVIAWMPLPEPYKGGDSE